MATRQRPLSPFMIGPYYRPQLTSVLSIIHRGTGVFLAAGAFVLAAALLAIAGGAAGFEMMSAWAGSPLGLIFLVATAFSLAYHFFNGIRHLLWDIGWGYELPRVYTTGYLVVGLSLITTFILVACAWRALGGAA
jgi:succinate dehydrogenase / fumarate reductase cytochrome b subunit